MKSKATTRRRSSPDDLPVLYSPMNECLHCHELSVPGDGRLRVYGGHDQGDGSILKYVECHRCKNRQRIVWDKPDDVKLEDSDDGREDTI